MKYKYIYPTKIKIDWLNSSINSFNKIPDIFKNEALALRPSPDLTVSQYAEQERIIPAGCSRKPGRWSNSVTPYLAFIMDLYNHPDIRHISLCFGTQLGKTETLINILCYIVDICPANVFLIYPRDEDAKQIVRTRLKPSFELIESIRSKIPEDSSLYQTLEMHFPGMILYLAGANSAAALAQKPVLNLIRDEIDKPSGLLGMNADWLSESEERTKSFWDIRKIIDASSPTLENHGIWAQIQSSHVRYKCYIPCYHCKKKMIMKFSQIKWEGGNDERQAFKTAHYVCESCGSIIDSRQKIWMLSQCEWKADDNLFPSSENYWVSAQLPSWYSPLLTFGDVAEKFVRANNEKKRTGNIGPLQGFINNWCAEPWKQRIITPERIEIRKSTCEYELRIVPEHVLALTIGIDVQKDGFYYAVWGFERDTTNWLVDYGKCSTWKEIEHILFDTVYPGKQGLYFSFWRVGFDMGGAIKMDDDMNTTEATAQFIKKYHLRSNIQLYPTKGASTPLLGYIKLGSSIEKNAEGKPLPQGIRHIIIDTNKMKDKFFYKLSLGASDENGGAHLPKDVSDEFISHLLSEEKRLNRKGIESWVQIAPQNHWLDCSIIAHALAESELFGGVEVLRYMVARKQQVIDIPKKKEGQKNINRPQTRRW